MRAILLGTLGLTALAAPTVAAELPVKAPPPAPVVTWTGCYLGVHMGASFGRGTDTVRATSRRLPPGSAWTNDLNVSGVLGGGQIGCNYQFSNSWVVGIEGDGAWAHQHDEGSLIAPWSTAVVRATMFDVTEQWFATARGRFGYATDKWFIYVTGGGAWADVRGKVFEGTIPTFIGVSQSRTFSGWTAGAGFEWWLMNNVSAKIEYLFVDLGSQDFFGAPVFNTSVTELVRLKLQDHVVRFGLNYHFNWENPVVARY